MLKKLFGYRINFDFAGAFVAGLCAIHCSAVPILISLGVLGGLTHSHIIDWTLLIIGVLIAGYSLTKDYKFHKKRGPLALVFLGFLFLTVGILSHHIVWLNILGGIIIIVGHFLNYQAVKKKMRYG